jgi:hypothetical protein
MNAIDRFSISADVMTRDLGEETVLLDLSSGTYFGLDAVGSRIWQLIGAGKNLAEICDTLFDEFEVSREDLKRDSEALMEELKVRRLIIVE